MGRRPKPLAELELSGALAARPGRYKKRLEAAKVASQAPIAQPAPSPAKPLPLGSAPKWLGPDEKAIWKELAKTHPNLTFSDRFHLEIATKLTHKLRTAEGGLKGQEYSQLLGILDRFAPRESSVPIPEPIPESIPAVINAPVEDTRTEYEKRWDEFAAEMDEANRREAAIKAEMELTGRDYYDIRCEWFPEEAERQRQMLADNSAFIDKLGAQGRWTDNKPKQEEKVEYISSPTPQVAPIEMDPARKQEQMLRRWSM